MAFIPLSARMAGASARIQRSNALIFPAVLVVVLAVILRVVTGFGLVIHELVLIGYLLSTIVRS